VWERRSYTFFTFCFEMSMKLFQNGYFFGCVPTPFLLDLGQHNYLPTHVRKDYDKKIHLK